MTDIQIDLHIFCLKKCLESKKKVIRQVVYKKQYSAEERDRQVNYHCSRSWWSKQTLIFICCTQLMTDDDVLKYLAC
jgi:hypothetical protein